MTTPERYAGKPLLRLLECYVLWAVGKLEAKDESTLTLMEPNLRKALGQTGTWREIIVQTMDLPDELPEQIRTMWTRNQEIARQNNVTLSPQQFAEMFVDNNFEE